MSVKSLQSIFCSEYELEKYIDDDKLEDQYFHLNEYIKYMDILDQRRKHKWRVVLHDVYDLLSKHCDPEKIENLHATPSSTE